MSLTPKQQRFVEEYLVDLNAAGAARRAGYGLKAAMRMGSENLAKPAIAAAIEVRQKVLREKAEITADMVIRELAKIAFGDQRRLMSWGPGGVKLRASADLSDEEAAAVAEVSETTTLNGGSLKIKAHDKVGALKLLGEHLGLFKQKVEVSGKDGAPIAHTHTNVTPEELAQAVRGVREKF